MFTNHYDVTVHTENGDTTLELRLPIKAQIELQHKYKEDTRSTLFDACGDDEKYIEVLTKSLNWTGNKNTVVKGEDLMELLIDNGDMGIVRRQQIMVEIGRVSGIFDDKERDAVMNRIENAALGMFSDFEDTGIDGADEKNV